MTYYEKKRRELGLSQSEVANYLGISYKRYALIGRGKVKMPANLIDKFNELINKSKGERTIDRLNREEVVNAWWNEMAQKIGYGKYKINEKMKEFNIDTLKELAHLLGYKNQSQLCNYLSGNWEPTFNTKNMIYSFFENELNIQPPKETKKQDTKRKVQKQSKMIELSHDEIQSLYNWYDSFDIEEWVKTNNISITKMGVECGVASNTIRAFIRKEQPRTYTLKKVYDYIVNYNNKETVEVAAKTEEEPQTIEYTLTPVPEEDVPQEIKDSTQEIVNEMTKNNTRNDIVNELLEKYNNELCVIDTDIEETESYIKDLEYQIKEKTKELEKLEMKKSIYEELVDTLENGD